VLYNHVSFLIIIFAIVGTWDVCICYICIFHNYLEWSSQPLYIYEIKVEFKIIMLKLDHKYLIWGITHDYKIVVLEISHTYNLYVFIIQFQIDMLAIHHKFLIDLFFYH
jgi:hypothetical protein